MTSLGFEMLDRHVVHGRGEQVASTDAHGSVTFAKLTEQVAELAGGLTMLGVQQGDLVHVQLPPGTLLVRTVCAVIRLGAVPGNHGPAHILEVDGVARVRAGEHDLELTFVQRAGRAQPAPALHQDRDGYGDDARGTFRDIVETLLSGSTAV